MRMRRRRRALVLAVRISFNMRLTSLAELVKMMSPFRPGPRMCPGSDIVVKLRVEQFVEEHTGARKPVFLVESPFSPQLFDHGAVVLVAGDEVVKGRERHPFRHAVDVHALAPSEKGVDNQIEIAAVVVDLGYMDVVDGVVDGGGNGRRRPSIRSYSSWVERGVDPEARLKSLSAWQAGRAGNLG